MTKSNGNLPAGWSEVYLGDIAQVIRGVTYKKDVASADARDGTVPLLRSGNVQERLTYSQPVYVPQELVKEQQMLRTGDILVSTSNSRELVGKAAQLRESWRGTFGAFCAVVRPISPELDMRFLGYFFSSPAYRGEVAGWSAATNNIANIRVSRLQELRIPLPTLDEQTRIVSEIERVLTRVDEGRGRFGSALRGAKVYVASCLAAAFSGSLISMPATEVRVLDELATIQSGITKGRPAAAQATHMAYIRTANVQAGYLDLSEIKTLPVTAEQRSRHLLRPGDVLVLEGGDADKVGRGWIWESQIEDCLHQNHVFAVRTDVALLEPRYLAYFINAPQARAYFLACAKQTTNLASINKTQLRALPVPLIPLDAQRQVVRALHLQLAGVETYRSQLRRDLANEIVLRRSILHAAFHGKLTTSAVEASVAGDERLASVGASGR